MKINQFTTKIFDIPCICEVTAYSRAKPATQLDEGDDAEFEYNILTLEGEPYWLLESRVTPEVEARLIDEWEATILEHKHYINERD